MEDHPLRTRDEYISWLSSYRKARATQHTATLLEVYPAKSVYAAAGSRVSPAKEAVILG
jgi:hypothetical protein